LDGIANIELHVRDTGIGIPEDVQERLFQPFEQADTSISKRFGGTGLGLAITKHLVEMMGGEVKLVSVAGAGREFTIHLPLTCHANDTARHVGSPATLQGKRILVLDDRASNREIVASYLGEGGADVICAETPAEALHALREAESGTRPFDLAIIDMVPPECGGLDVADMIRAEPALGSVAMIMLTSLSWKGDLQMARLHGFREFRTKPVRRGDLLNAAARALACCDQPAATKIEHLPIEADRLQTQGMGARVLVAEDNPVNVEVAKEYLGNLNCTITLVETGVEAVAAFLQPRFDIILMDCQMPEMDGLAATRRIRETEKAFGMPRTTIVAVTANAYAEDRAKCVAAGMDDYLSKPFTEDQLQKLLAKWIKQPVNAFKPAEENPRTRTETGSHNPPATSDGGKTSSLDANVLSTLKKRHPALLARLIGTFSTIAPELSSQLSTAATSNNRDVMRAAAHSLKSSSANIGAVRLSALCGELEDLLTADVQPDRMVASQTLASRVEQELAAVTAELLVLAEPLQGSVRAAGATAA
jgi:CheY-like chemotaxis protein/HPt (histidine-containing phosphotransfer) domain-containing protein